MTDEEIGKRVREFSEELGVDLTKCNNTELFFAVSFALINLATTNGAEKLELNIPDVTMKGKPVGSWKILVKKI